MGALRWNAVLLCLGWPLLAQAGTHLALLTMGSPGGEFERTGPKLELETRPSNDKLYLFWSTSESGATAVSWVVSTSNPPTAQNALVSGTQTLQQTQPVGLSSWFEISAGFIPKPTPAEPVTWYLSVTPVDAQKNPLGSASNVVEVIERKAKPQPPTHFPTLDCTMPTLKFIRYHAVATSGSPGAVEVKVGNKHPSKTTDAVGFQVTDSLGLIKMSKGVIVPKLKPGDAETVLIPVEPNYPGRPIGLSDENWPWQHWVDNYLKGVDLTVKMVSTQPDADSYSGCFETVAVFKGANDSCHDHKLDGDEVFIDGGGHCPCAFGPKMPVEAWSQTNGFQFGNTGAFTATSGDYDLGDLQSIYGDCSVFIWPCIPIPDPMVAVYMGIIDVASQPGRCFGFSLTSLRLVHGDFPLSRYNSEGPTCDVWHLKGKALSQKPKGDFSSDPLLARDIHRQHALQFSDEAVGATVEQLTEGAVVDSAGNLEGKLKAHLPCVMGINFGGPGHAVVALRVRDHADGSFNIDIDNPNVPFDPEKESTPEQKEAAAKKRTIFVEPDGSYSYDEGGSDGKYKGHAQYDFFVYPYHLFDNPHIPGIGALSHIPSFGGVTGDAAISQVTDEAGHTLLGNDGRLNHDPKTRLAHAAIWEPLDGPPGLKLFAATEAKGLLRHTVTAKKNGSYRVRFVGAGGFGVDLDDVPAQAGVTDEIGVDSEAARVHFTTGAATKKVHGKLIAHASDKSAHAATVTLTAARNAKLQVGFDAERENIEYRHTGAAGSLTLELWSSHDPKATYVAKPISVADGDVLTIKPNWHELTTSPGVLHVQKKDGSASDAALH